MSIILKRNEYKDSAVSRIGDTVFDFISGTLVAGKNLVIDPLASFSGSISSLTKSVLIIGAIGLGVYILIKVKSVKGILP